MQGRSRRVKIAGGVACQKNKAGAGDDAISELDVRLAAYRDRENAQAIDAADKSAF